MTTQGRKGGVTNPLQRVKVYRLNEEGKWDDRGTGHVAVEFLERSEAAGLIVIDEEDSETLLVHRISSEDIYRRQEETIIAWRDPEFATELALSFQEPMGCSFIWDQICSVQRSIHFPSIGGMENALHLQEDDIEHSGTSQLNDDGFCGGSAGDARDLPEVEVSTLPQILKIVMEGCVMDHIRVAELIVQDRSFIPKLLDVFRMCEDLENEEGLHLIYKIIKGIILLNSNQIFERIFNDDYIMDIVGALEYDPDVSFHQKHREFLKEQVVFKEAIPIKDASLLSKIHQSYRVGYIKDVILPRVLDEGTFSTLNSIIHSNNGVVVTALKDDNTFIQELFAKLRAVDTSNEVKKKLILFLQEFCMLSKSLLLANQARLFRDLVENGIFDIITSAMESGDKLLCLTGNEILIMVLNQDPSLVRTFLIQQPGNVLLGLLVKGMSTDFGEDMHSQYLEIIRMLLDPYTMTVSQRDSIVEIFYENYMDQLVDVVASSCASDSADTVKRVGDGSQNAKTSSNNRDSLSNIMDLLCFCVQQHNIRIRYYFLRKGVMEKVLCLTQRKEKCLVISAIRFMRTIIGRNDEALNRHIVTHNLLRPVIEAFIVNGTRYNLLNSAVLELVEYIRKENIKCLVEYLVKKFCDQVEQLDCVGTFQALKLRYDQNLEGCIAKGSSVASASNHSSQMMTNNANNRKRLDERALEKEEEDYFNEDSDDEEDTATAQRSCIPNKGGHVDLVNGTPTSSSLTSGSISLVDYEDEDYDISLPESATQEASEFDDLSNCRTSSDGSASVSESASPKRKLVPENNYDDELDCLKRQKSLGNLNDSCSLGNKDCQNLKTKGSNYFSQTKDKKDFRTSKENNVAVIIFKNDSKNLVASNADSNGHHVEESKNIDCMKHGVDCFHSGDDSGSNLRGPLNDETGEGRHGNTSSGVATVSP